LLVLTPPAACAEDPCLGSVEAACGKALRNQDATRANIRVDSVVASIERGFNELKDEIKSMARGIAENARGIAENARGLEALRTDFHSWTAGPASKLVLLCGTVFAGLVFYMARNPLKVAAIWSVVTGPGVLPPQHAA